MARNRRSKQSQQNQQSAEPLPITPSNPPDHIGLLMAAFVLFVVSVFGLYQLITTALPRIGGELWLFFILLHLATASLSLPIIRYLNVRFTPIYREVPPAGVIIRQSTWVGLYVVTCAWLQIPRALNLALMIFIALVFVVIEAFLRSREVAAERES